LSIVTAARDECGNVEPFLRGVETAVVELGVRAEIIFVDDGSRDGTAEAVENFIPMHGAFPIRLFRHRQPSGLSAAIATGFAHARGSLLCLIPADLESRPEYDVPALYRAMDRYTDVVCGRRLRRGDGKELSSRIYAAANRLLFGVHVHDGNWIKLIRREKVAGLWIYRDWHPYLLALLASRGCRVKEVETLWHPRQSGKSKFGFSRIPAGIAAIVAVKIFLGFRDRSLLFSLWLAFWLACAGVLVAAIAAWAGHGSAIWVPGWVLCGAMLMASFVAVDLGLALQFWRWERGPPALVPLHDFDGGSR
jgi:dolichol-phosphate mannosyltransferase